MSARHCKYCERAECDTDCSFADRHTNAEPRKTAAEWRAIGAARTEALVVAAREWRRYCYPTVDSRYGVLTCELGLLHALAALDKERP